MFSGSRPRSRSRRRSRSRSTRHELAANFEPALSPIIHIHFRPMGGPNPNIPPLQLRRNVPIDALARIRLYVGLRGESVPNFILGTNVLDFVNARNLLQAEADSGCINVNLTVVWNGNLTQEILHLLRPRPWRERIRSVNFIEHLEVRLINETNLHDLLTRGLIYLYGPERMSNLFDTPAQTPLNVYQAFHMMELMCGFETSPVAEMTEAQIEAGLREWREGGDFRITRDQRFPEVIWWRVELANPNTYLRGSHFVYHQVNIDGGEEYLRIDVHLRDGVQWELNIHRRGRAFLLYFFTDVIPAFNRP